ncbi:hypothetical protein [Nitrospira sp. KM1]|uniref:PKD domain-containing protein n=1 Tax=Nitrospira sp. KM1 TaxID=1936990 RepID=UPI0015678A06|nr:hypothetical protein [Nitrospira sp. KM1]
MPQPRKSRAFRIEVFIWALGLSLVILPDGTAKSFVMIAPGEGVNVASGESVPVAIQAGQEASVKHVAFYWYRWDEEPLATRRGSPASFAGAIEDRSISGNVKVPAEGIGMMRLLAVGEVSRGRLDGYEEFDEVTVLVEPRASLSSVEFSIQQPWRLDTIGKRWEVPVVGQFDDGVVRPLAGLRAGSRFSSSDERVISVDQSGWLRVRGNGRAHLTVENRGKVGTLEVLVHADDSPNREPIAQVEKELRVKSGSLVILSGLRSSDPDGDPLKYEWRQLRGHHVPLTNVDQVKATFIAPPVSESKRFQFALTVTDMAGPDLVKGAQSRPALITVWVDP